jgi:activator of 2-hydroxyglutaryl-CoA dehydratase
MVEYVWLLNHKMLNVLSAFIVTFFTVLFLRLVVCL